MQFTPLKDFHDADLRSHYCVGLSYTVRPGNDKLAKKVEAWLADGKVRLGAPDAAAGPQAGSARVSGTGTVK